MAFRSASESGRSAVEVGLADSEIRVGLPFAEALTISLTATALLVAGDHPVAERIGDQLPGCQGRRPPSGRTRPGRRASGPSCSASCGRWRPARSPWCPRARSPVPDDHTTVTPSGMCASTAAVSARGVDGTGWAIAPGVGLGVVVVEPARLAAPQGDAGEDDRRRDPPPTSGGSASGSAGRCRTPRSPVRRRSSRPPR